jgi:uncharacterized protein (TIGR02246 family)
MVMQGVTKTNDQLAAALGRGDASGCAAVYTEDAKLLPPNSPLVTGKQAIQAFWQGGIDMGIKGATLQTVELEEHGDTVIEVGTYTLDIQPEGADLMKDQGKYVVIFKRQTDGSWKLATDMFNSDLPAAG